MKNRFLRLVVVALYAFCLQEAFSSAPAPQAIAHPASSSVVSSIDQKIDQLTVEDIKDIKIVRDLIKANPERVLNHCVSLALTDFDKKNKMIDKRWLDFFADSLFFNNKKYQHCFEQYYEKNPDIKNLIHYVSGDEDDFEKNLYAFQGPFPIGDGIIGHIEYTSDSYERRPEIVTLAVAQLFRRKAIASNLLKRALDDLKTIFNESREVHFLAIPSITPSDKVQGVSSKIPLTLNELIDFYQKNGAVLIKKYNHAADMKFPASSRR